MVVRYVSERTDVSVLFSEPKIPQFEIVHIAPVRTRRSFSALQRAENSSMTFSFRSSSAYRSCFSALQRAENSSMHIIEFDRCRRDRFSALQRAENSSIELLRLRNRLAIARFSALQRAENSSMLEPRSLGVGGTLFQCSSASRKFLNRRSAQRARR